MARAVAKNEDNAVSVVDESLFEADAGAGMENMGQDDLALPFLKVLSGNDPVLDERDDARKGDIYNTVRGHLQRQGRYLRHSCRVSTPFHSVGTTGLWNGRTQRYLRARGHPSAH